jgi:hypothetical protein
MGLKLKGSQLLLAHTDDVNQPADDTTTISKSRETLIDASKEVDVEVIAEKTKLCCCLVTRMQTTIGI